MEVPVTSADAPETAPSIAPQSVRPRSQRVIVAAIAFLLWCRPVGTAMSVRWPPTGPILFQAAASECSTRVVAWWRLRCGVCGGNTAASELTTRLLRQEPAIDWKANRPRRGRPPRWLVAYRTSD